MLYLDGRRELLAERCVAVVGSRQPSPQGDDNARHFAAGLGDAGFCVVSGLAQGIDGAAHEAALNTRGSTIAVLGTGPDKVFPLDHAELSRHVARRGLLVSEYFVGTPPMAPNFPQRNRIIAGLSEGCLVVEAAMKSGSLITARQASEAGREVFAVPGPIHAPQSRGCHHLLKQGACLVQELDDLINELPAGGLPRTASLDLERDGGAEADADADETPDARRLEADDDHPLLRAIGRDTVSLEQLSQRSGWPQDELNATLLDLELDGRVARLPGALFQRRGSA
ncbi:DNA-processing protein DprA [Roseateles chitinivorans]|uniref:DNA-processing protein DprA n=1 Tax=Roseateles chitinivorans TaxID=2917965 RepID=UPI003D672AFD